MIGDRWGVTAAEVERRYPCDELVRTPTLQAWRAVTVHVTAAELWPWVVQIRLAPYSYDWIDNLGRRSPQRLSALPDPTPGQPFTTVGTRSMGRVLSVAREQQVTARIAGAVMSYVLVPTPTSTRLVLKVVMASGRWIAPLVSVGDLVMARRQLLNLKRLAEGAD